MFVCVWVSRLFFFLFKQKTAYEMRISDWSSDVCSSDLVAAARAPFMPELGHRPALEPAQQLGAFALDAHRGVGEHRGAHRAPVAHRGAHVEIGRAHV